MIGTDTAMSFGSRFEPTCIDVGYAIGRNRRSEAERLRLTGNMHVT